MGGRYYNVSRRFSDTFYKYMIVAKIRLKKKSRHYLKAWPGKNDKWHTVSISPQACTF